MPPGDGDSRAMHTAKTTVVWLSPEARTAKQRRRRLERRYRRTGNMSDKRAYKDAVVAAHDTIMKSWVRQFS